MAFVGVLVAMLKDKDIIKEFVFKVALISHELLVLRKLKKRNLLA